VKTVVFQSFRTSAVPGWIRSCMDSVRTWAHGRGFDYRFLDDSFLDLPPRWYRERCAGEMCPLTDLARLMAAQELLREGYERTIWMDADILLFAPESLEIDNVSGFAFSFELWPFVDAAGQLQCRRAANNSVSIFDAGNRQLDFLVDACLRIASAHERVPKLAIGARFVTALAQIMPVPLLTNIGIFSPVLMQALASGHEGLVAAYAAQLPARIAAANMCNSLVGQAMEGFTASEADYQAAVKQCLDTRGEMVNRFVRHAAQAAEAAPGSR
jgi:hypothetical protein